MSMSKSCVELAVAKYHILCSVCGTDFIAKNTRGRLCSVTCKNKYRYISTPEKYRAKTLYVYGLTLDSYKEMEDAQAGLCYICKNPETHINMRTGRPQHLSVDHDHSTGKVRKLLCKQCNLLVGQVEKDIDKVELCVNYLKELKRTRG